MIGTARALLLIARYFRRIATSLERMEELYALDCASRGVYKLDPKAEPDPVELSYGIRIPQ